jgi:hypothetical protein
MSPVIADASCLHSVILMRAQRAEDLLLRLVELDGFWNADGADQRPTVAETP